MRKIFGRVKTVLLEKCLSTSIPEKDTFTLGIKCEGALASSATSVPWPLGVIIIGNGQRQSLDTGYSAKIKAFMMGYDFMFKLLHCEF